VLGVLLLSLASAPAAAFSKAIWGKVNRQGVNQFPLYKRLGVSIYETELDWNQVASQRPRRATDPNDPAYRWPAAIRQAVVQARRFHMRMLIEIIRTPRWANGDRSSIWAPKDPRDYADFASAAAREYPSVHLWMIWGEPTRSPNFQPLTPAVPGAQLNAAQRRAPHVYAQLLDSAYGALKRVSARNLVIGGCTYTTGDIDTQQWIENLRLPNGHAPRMDMYAHNPFGWEEPNFSDPPSPSGEVQFSDLPRLAHWIDRNLRPGLPIFLAEWTIPTNFDRQFNFAVNPATAATWVRAGLRLARGWKRIFGLGWVDVYDAPPRTYGGLLTTSGKRKPTFYAFAS
jgi:hypothetical protein